MSAALRSLKLNPAAMTAMTRAPGGMVGRYIVWVGARVKKEAISLADQRLTSSPGDGGYIDRFEATLWTSARGPRVVISNDSPHASYLERGTKPHVIRPRYARVLRFYAGDPGSENVRFARSVNHPGTQPYRILEDALRIGARAGLRAPRLGG